jgi:inosine-uridine nucleoside N-ribohydrolase
VADSRASIAGRPRPIILDCDPGHDDALAILLAIARPELELLAVTTVAGNVPLAASTRNAGSVLALAERSDIPLAAGADRPLKRPLSTATIVHGGSGLEGAPLPEPATEPDPRGALALASETLEAATEPVTLVATGPCTNVATLLKARPDLHERVAAIHLMGGSIGAGNWTASAEFNIWVDPDAAAVVFESGLPVTMMGLDVTHQTVVPVARSDDWAELGSQAGRVFADLFRYFAVFRRERYGWDGSPIHDATVIAHLALPELVETHAYRVDVEVTSELTRGRTVVDLEGLSGLPPNAEVGTGIDAESFLTMVEEALASFD